MFCKRCQNLDDMRIFHSAVMEHRRQNRGRIVRILPEPPITQEAAREEIRSMDRRNRGKNYKMKLWYLKKCLQEKEWCGE